MLLLDGLQYSAEIKAIIYTKSCKTFSKSVVFAIASRIMKQNICLYIVVTMLAPETIALKSSESQTTLSVQNANDSLNSLERSFCSPENVSRMTHDMQDLISTINVDMDNIGLDLAHKISEVQKQTLKFHVKKDVVAFNCKLSSICIKPFTLKSIMKSNVDQDFNYIVDFWAVDETQIMYLDKGKPSYIYEEDFGQFAKANVFIDLKNVTSHLIYSRNDVNKKLVNDANGTCLCKSSTSLVNVKRKQLSVERQLKKVVSNFVGITTSMDDAYIKGNICKLSDLRRKRSLFGSYSSHDEIRRVTDAFQSNFKRILVHERDKSKYLQHLKENLQNDENDIS